MRAIRSSVQSLVPMTALACKLRRASPNSDGMELVAIVGGKALALLAFSLFQRSRRPTHSLGFGRGSDRVWRTYRRRHSSLDLTFRSSGQRLTESDASGVGFSVQSSVDKSGHIPVGQNPAG